eukprot:Rhum_TRINITY_DN11804_c0_g1::Rhum_TRINITY_DN11804_c0_g1_i1::g.47166::m.47166
MSSPPPLAVTVVACAGLPQADADTPGNFYVKAQGSDGEAFQTKVVTGSLDPQFGDTFTFKASGPVTFTVMDKDLLTPDDYVARCECAAPTSLANADAPTVLKLSLAKAFEGKAADPTLSVIFAGGDPAAASAVGTSSAVGTASGVGTAGVAAEGAGGGGAAAAGSSSGEPAADGVLQGVRGKALLIGINYVGQPDTQLEGAVSAAHGLRNVLKQEGFKGAVRVLADDGCVEGMPTRANVEAAVAWMLADVDRGDGLFLYYAGRVQREGDGTFSLLPADHRDAGVVSSRTLFHTFSTRLPEAARLLCVMDTPGGGTLSPANHPILSFKATHPETDLANFSLVSGAPPPPPAALSEQHRGGSTVVVSAASTSVMAEGTLASVLGGVLAGMRGQGETSVSEAGRVFKAKVDARFPGLVDPLLAGDGGYVADDFAAWMTKPLADLQAELAPFGVEAKRAAPLQNLAKEVFLGRPLDGDDAVAPPSLATLLERLHAGHPQTDPSPTAFHVLCESDVRVDLAAPLLPAAGWSRPAGVSIPEAGGTSLEASAAAALLARTTEAHPLPWRDYTGYISTGGDILGSPRLLTLQEAYLLADRYPECQGFSVKGGGLPLPHERVWVYFKDKWDLHGTGWTSFKRPGSGDESSSTALLMGGGGGGGSLAGAGAVGPRALRAPAIGSLSPGRERHGAGAMVPAHGDGGGGGALYSPAAPAIDPWNRQRLANFYNYYNPSKLPSVVPTLLVCDFPPPPFFVHLSVILNTQCPLIHVPFRNTKGGS